MSNHNDISSPLAQRLGLHVQNVIEQISVRLKYFLDNVNTIYESHGINFPIKQNYTNLMRMLTPFELLSKYQMIQNNQLLSSALVQKIKHTLQTEVSIQQQNYEEYYQNENQSVSQNESEKYYNQQKKQPKEILQSSALSMLRGMREQKEKELNQKQRGMYRDKKEKDRGQKDEQKQKLKQKQKQKQGFNISDRIKRDSTKNYRQKGIIGKKRQNLSVIKPNVNHYMRQSIYITQGSNYLTQEMQKQLFQWATSQLLRGNQLLIQDIMYQAKYIGRSIPNLIVSQGWIAKFMKKYDSLRRLFRKSKGLQKLQKEEPIKMSFNPSIHKSKSLMMKNEVKNDHQKQQQQYIYEEEQEFEQSDNKYYENEQFEPGSKHQRKDFSKKRQQEFDQYELNMGLQSSMLKNSK